MSVEYRDRGYVRLQRLVPAELCGFLVRHLLLLERTGQLDDDVQVPGAASVYGDPAFDTLLEIVGPTLADLIDLRLVPTYSFARLYRSSDELAPHTDRAACEHSLTVHLGGASPEPWPIHLRDRDGTDIAVDLEVGDALCYRGCELPHWREPLREGVYAQLFLHYVSADGPNAHLRYDGRRDLGLPRE